MMQASGLLKKKEKPGEAVAHSWLKN